MSIHALVAAIALAGAPITPDPTPDRAAPPSGPAATLPGTSTPLAITPPLPTDSPAPDTAITPGPAAGSAAGDKPGDIVVISKPHATKADPLAPLNAEVFGATMAVDSAVTGPVALTYQRKVPSILRQGIRNFLDNLDEPVIFLNFLVQLHPGQSLAALGRLGINSTIGIGGLIDVAKRRPINLPHRPNGFGDSLGYYGVKPGPYFYLPIIGPTTLRDLAGGGLDMLVLPRAFGAPFNQTAFTLPTGLVDAVDSRATFEAELQKLRLEPTGLYRARRALYLRKRQAEIDGLKH